jgi:hypothetical protein
MPRKILANGMAAYLDFSIGCLIIVLLGFTFNTELLWWQILLGGLLALTPDIDVVPTLIRGRTPSFDHRQTIFHRPMLVLATVTILGYLLGGTFWAIACFVLVLYHFLHDVDWFGNQYGIAWLWPYSSQFWGPYGSFSPPTISHETWLKDNWLQPSRLSISELGLALLCMIILGTLMGLLTNWWFLLLLILAYSIPLIVWYT